MLIKNCRLVEDFYEKDGDSGYAVCQEVLDLLFDIHPEMPIDVQLTRRAMSPESVLLTFKRYPSGSWSSFVPALGRETYFVDQVFPLLNRFFQVSG